MKKVKNIAVITGTRSEYGILKPLLKKIQHSKELELSLYVAGMHLLKKYGKTIVDINKDGFTATEKIVMYGNNEHSPTYFGVGLGKGIINFTKAFSKNKPDMVLVLGDRLESLAATLAAALLKIPIGHIHGGDKTDSGHIDESTRHAISKYSHIHFAPTKVAARRLMQMGEEKFRIHMVGTLSIDSILETPKQTKQEVCTDLGLDSNKEIMVCLFLPLPIESHLMSKHVKELFTVIRELKKQTLVIYPNNDAGSEDIIREIEEIRDLPHVTFAKNLPSEQYINLLRNADVLIGNSSSGIIEAPTLKLAVINIGSRNVGREHSDNILFIDPDSSAIKKAIEKALYDKKFKAQVRKCKNPYGIGGTARAIINILKKTELNNKLMLKKVTY